MISDVNEHGKVVGADLNGWEPPLFPAPKILEGRFCSVEPLNVALHFDALWDSNSEDKNSVMWTYLPYGPFSSKDEYRHWMEKVCQTDDPQWYAICDKQNSRAIGVASYLQIRPEHGCIEVGHLAYSPLLQRTLMSTEAMYLMMKYVFDLGYRRYEWKCNALNENSKSSAARLGFSYEGVFRQHLVFKGRNRDTAWFSILDSEWPEIQKCFQRWLSKDNFGPEKKQIISLSSLTRLLLKQTI